MTRRIRARSSILRTHVSEARHEAPAFSGITDVLAEADEVDGHGDAEGRENECESHGGL
jgi:hypothetical protein